MGAPVIGTPTLEFVLKRDRAVVLVSLGGLTGLAWIYLVVLAGNMGDVSAGDGVMAAMALRPWTALDFVLMFLMWVVMMMGMMVPSAAPMILLFSVVARKSRDQGHPFAPVGAFFCGYVVAWSAFSLGATVLQWGLERLALLSPMMASASPVLGGGLLIVAGAYQLTPLKDVCLDHCRAPARFLAGHWRPGVRGALGMGLGHGAFCVGCCWVLMGLLFVGGAMNLLWVAAIAVFVLVEKLNVLGRQGGRLSGVCLVLAGLFVVIQSWTV